MSYLKSPPNLGPRLAAHVRVDQARIDRLVTELRLKQSMFMAVIGGLLGAFAGTVSWAAITPVMHRLSDLMAIVVGPLVGAGVRTLGHGLERPYGYLGAAMSLVACVLGGTLSACIVATEQKGLPLGMALAEIDPATIPDLLAMTLNPLNVLFYLIAMCEGYYFSFRKITEAEIQRVMQIFER